MDRPAIFNWLLSSSRDLILLQGHKLDEVASVYYTSPDKRELKLKVLNKNFHVLHLAASDISSPFVLRLQLKRGHDLRFESSLHPHLAHLHYSELPRSTSALELGTRWFENSPLNKNVCNVCTDLRLTKRAYGDGVHNDQFAIQEAIDVVHKSGGGTVYLPPGTYKFDFSDGPQINLLSRVILKGAGQKATKLIYGFGKPGNKFVFVLLNSARQCGIADLSILNKNENDGWTNSRSITNQGSLLSSFFLSHVDADIANSDRIELKGNDIVITDCNLKSENTLLFLGTSHLVSVTYNTLFQKSGVHLDLTNSSRATVRFNRFILDANRGQIVQGCVRHGVAISFASEAVISENTFSVTNGPLKFNNDCEAVLSEGGGGVRTGEEIGSFIDEKTLSQSGAFTPGLVIAIVGGRGTGQCRSIASREAAKIRIANWEVDPDKNSVYSIFKWSNKNLCIENNEFNDWQRGVWLYHASCLNVVLRNNVFNGTDGVLAVPCQNASRDRGQFNPIWGLAVESNSFRTSPTNDLHAQGVCLIGDLQETRDLLGTLSLNTLIADNSVNPNSAYGSSPVDDEPHVPPLCSYLRVESGPLSQPAPPAMLGTMFAYNFSDPQLSSSARSLPPTINLNGGACGTTILGPSKFVDSEKYWNVPASHGSIDTAVHAEESE